MSLALDLRCLALEPGAVLERDDFLCHFDDRLHAVGLGRPPLADCAVVLQGEAEWVDLIVTGGAGCSLPMNLELLADTLLVPIGHGIGDLSDILRRRRRSIVEHVLQDEHAAADDRRANAARGQLEDTCLAQQSAAHTGVIRDICDRHLAPGRQGPPVLLASELVPV